MRTAYLTLGLFTALTSAYSRRHPRYMRIARQNNGTIADTPAVNAPAVSGIPLSTGVSSDAAAPVTSAAPLPTDAAGITTLTVSTTEIRTITSCLPEVIDCPTRTEDFENFPTEALNTVIVTDTVILTEVVCPVTEVPAISSSVLADASNGLITGSTLTPSETPSAAPLPTGDAASTITSAAPLPTGDAASGITTLTVSTTEIRTITSCLPEVIDCPTRTEDLANLPSEALNTVIVTDTVILTEVVCPVTEVPAISSSVIADATNGLITGSTLTPSETPAPGVGVTESLDAIASSTTAAPAPGEKDTTTTQTTTSTGTRTVTVKKPVTTTVGASPGGGNGAGNGNGKGKGKDNGNGGGRGNGNGNGNNNGGGKGNGNGNNNNDACVCPPASTITEAAVTVTEPASTVYVTVTDAAAGVGGNNGNGKGNGKGNNKPKATTTAAAPAATTTAVSNETGEVPDLGENDTGAEAPGATDDNEDEDCPADVIVTVTSTSAAASATGSAIPSAFPSGIPELDTGAEAPDAGEGAEEDDTCPEDEVVTVTASASATEASVAPSVVPSLV